MVYRLGINTCDSWLDGKICTNQANIFAFGESGGEIGLTACIRFVLAYFAHYRHLSIRWGKKCSSSQAIWPFNDVDKKEISKIK